MQKNYLKINLEKPKFVSVQLLNATMEYPFFVPLRSPQQNNKEALTEAFLQLARQSGGRLKLLTSTNQIKIYGVWQLDNRRKQKRTQFVKSWILTLIRHLQNGFDKYFDSFIKKKTFKIIICKKMLCYRI